MISAAEFIWLLHPFRFQMRWAPAFAFGLPYFRVPQAFRFLPRRGVVNTRRNRRGNTRTRCTRSKERNSKPDRLLAKPAARRLDNRSANCLCRRKSGARFGRV